MMVVVEVLPGEVVAVKVRYIVQVVREPWDDKDSEW